MSEKENPSYYAIIPANVRYDSRLKANEKLMYGEITVLANKNGYCMARNRYFAELYGVSLSTVSRWINNLEKNDYIQIQVVRDPVSKEVVERRVYLKIAIPYMQKDQEGYSQKDQYPIDEKRKDNSTRVNTTSNNTIAHSSKYSDEFERWWSIYPRKQGKGKAYANWKREKLDSRVDELIEKLQQQVAMEYAFTEIGYIPHGSTYLNESRYDDDVIPKRVNNERSGNNNPKGESYKEFATELSNRVDKNRHIYDELPDDYVF